MIGSAGLDFAQGPNEFGGIPGWNIFKTQEDAILTAMEPATTNMFMFSVQPSTAQSCGRAQQDAGILKSVPWILTGQKLLFGILRGFETAFAEPEDQHRPDRAVYYTRLDR